MTFLSTHEKSLSELAGLMVAARLAGDDGQAAGGVDEGDEGHQDGETRFVVTLGGMRPRLAVLQSGPTAPRQLVEFRKRVVDGMVLRLHRGVEFVPPLQVHRDGHLAPAVGACHGYRSGTPDRAVMAPDLRR